MTHETQKNGLYCDAGYRYLSIGSDGTISPCNYLLTTKTDKNHFKHRHVIGNIFEQDVVLRKQFMKCPVQQCEQMCDRHWSDKKIYKDDQVIDTQPMINSDVRANRKNPLVFIWAPSWKCNYSCPYCILPKDNSNTTADQWVEAFDRFFNTNQIDGGLVHVTGGEPLFYKNIGKVFKLLGSRGFKIGLTTNLSSDVWNNIVHATSPSDFSSIACSFHPMDPKFRMPEFNGRILALKSLGYPVGVNFVAHPGQIMLTPVHHGFFTRHGIPFTLIPMVGKHDGFHFPSVESYPPGMRKILKKYCNNVVDDHNRFRDGERVE
jgi:hypothetical protein